MRTWGYECVRDVSDRCCPLVTLTTATRGARSRRDDEVSVLSGGRAGAAISWCARCSKECRGLKGRVAGRVAKIPWGLGVPARVHPLPPVRRGDTSAVQGARSGTRAARMRRRLSRRSWARADSVRRCSVQAIEMRRMLLSVIF